MLQAGSSGHSAKEPWAVVDPHRSKVNSCTGLVGERYHWWGSRFATSAASIGSHEGRLSDYHQKTGMMVKPQAMDNEDQLVTLYEIISFRTVIEQSGRGEYCIKNSERPQRFKVSCTQIDTFWSFFSKQHHNVTNTTYELLVIELY